MTNQGAVANLRESVVVALLAGQRLGFRITDVVEVLAMVEVTPIPDAPSSVEGVVDVRGVLVPVLDLRARFGLEPRPAGLDDRLVLARMNEKQKVVALAVDSVDTALVLKAEFDAVAGLAPDSSVSGAARLEDGLLLVHDVDKFLSGDEVLILDAALARHSASAAEGDHEGRP